MLITLGLCLTVLGQDALPGSNLSLQQAKAEARVIVAADVVKVEDVIRIGAASLVSGVDLKPSTVLKGKVKGEMLKEVLVSAGANERYPEKGEEFIFFIAEPEKGALHVLKMLPKTKENLKEIQAP